MVLSDTSEFTKDEQVMHEGKRGSILDVNGDGTYAVKYEKMFPTRWRVPGTELTPVKKTAGSPTWDMPTPRSNRRNKEGINQ